MKGLIIATVSIMLLAFINLWKSRKDALLSLLLALMVILIALSMILFPEPSFKAAERGLTVWWDVVLPALLPFFIAAELLMGMGVVHFIGVLMEPLMRPLFNVPGTGAFAMAMGIASGYPLGAALSARLKDDNLATKTEAERLMCFCNTSDPLFMTGAVAVGMFKRTDIATVIIAAHYLSALTVGLAMKFWRRSTKHSPPMETEKHGFAVMRAVRTMRKAQRESKKAFGELLGDSVKRSINTLLMILGFIVLFSVIFEILTMLQVTEYLSIFLSKVLPESILPKALHEAIVSGLFEITIGTSLASQTEAPLLARVAVASGIIAWSGLSVHAQVAAVIQPSRLSVWPYSIARLCQALLASAYTVLLMKPNTHKWALPAFEPVLTTGAIQWLHNLGIATGVCLSLISAIAIISIAMLIGHMARRNLYRR